MAQVDQPNNPNDPNNPNNPAPGTPNQPQAQQSNQPATSGGAGAVTATGAANVTGQAVGTNNPSQPFQNIASYLAANAPQSQQLASQVAGSVSQPIAQATNDIANASQTFTNAVNAGYTPENTNLINTVTSNPTAAVANPGTVSSFESQLNDTYGGPTDFTAAPNYSNLEAEAANAQALGSNALTPTGIQTLLQNIEGPQMTQGINNLDTLLLAQNPQNFQTIQNAGLVANNANDALQNFLTTQTTQDNASAQTAEQQAAAAAAAAESGLNTAAANTASPIESTFNNDLTATENYNSSLQDLISAISSGNLANLTQEQQTAIGLNPQILTALAQYPDIFPSVSTANMPSPQNYYSGPTGASLPTSPSQVETPDQAAAIAALQELNGGSTLSPLAGLSATAPDTPFTVPTDMGTYNNTGLADFLYNALEPAYLQYEQIPAGTNTTGNNAAQIQSYMQLLSQLTNESLPQPTPVQGGGGPPGFFV